MTTIYARVTRREFVRLSASLAAPLSAMIALPRRTRPIATAPALRIGVVEPAAKPTRDHELGIALGVDEARHAAQLFGGSIEIVPVARPGDENRRLSAIIGGGDTDCAAWGAHAAKMGNVYLNVGCTADALRGRQCSAAAFHVIPSDAMYRDAIAMVGGSSGDEATAWEPTLSRFGADTLNQRFRTRFQTGMTSLGWAAWMAVKILWESALRQKSGEGSAIGTYLTRENTQFDGHKGQPLSFRLWDHQLRQPIYVVSNDKNKSQRVREVPELTDGSLRDVLDELGNNRASSTCALGK